MMPTISANAPSSAVASPKNAREGDKQILIEMADELQQEAERIEANVEPGA